MICYSSLLVVYEGNDDVTVEYEKPETCCKTTCCYDADVSSCSTDFNLSHEDSHQFEPDGGIGQDHEEENMDSNHCLYDEDAVATCSNTKIALRSPTGTIWFISINYIFNFINTFLFILPLV